MRGLIRNVTSPGGTSQPHTWTLPPNLPHTFLPPPAQVAPVVDASSGQSRADVLGIFMSAVLLLTGLQWLSLKPREMQPVGSCAEGVVMGKGGAEGWGAGGASQLAVVQALVPEQARSPRSIIPLSFSPIVVPCFPLLSSGASGWQRGAVGGQGAGAQGTRGGGGDELVSETWCHREPQGGGHEEQRMEFAILLPVDMQPVRVPKMCA